MAPSAGYMDVSNPVSRSDEGPEGCGTPSDRLSNPSEFQMNFGLGSGYEGGGIGAPRSSQLEASERLIPIYGWGRM